MPTPYTITNGREAGYMTATYFFTMKPTITPTQLDANCHVLIGKIEAPALFSKNTFASLWGLRPAEKQHIRIAGRRVPIPRRQQAFGCDYAFSGQVSRAVPVPDILMPFLDCCRQNVDMRFNALLVNFYDAELGERIGRHSDETRGLIAHTPIVTISLGAERVFRLRRVASALRHDFLVENGTVLVIPWETNQQWTHEVPHRKRQDFGQRISITLRAFLVQPRCESSSTAEREEISS